MLWFIEHHAQHRLGNAGAVKELVSGAELILKYCDIRPISSRFSHLYGRLYRGMSQWNLQAGDPWMAMWQANLGQKLSGSSPGAESAEDMLFAADRAFRLGHIRSAAASYLKAETEAAQGDVRAKARIGRVICHKLSGDLEHAWALAVDAAKALDAVVESETELAWQARLCQALKARSVEPLYPSWEPRSPLYQARYALTAALLAYACSAGSLPRKLKRASTYRANFAEIVKDSPEWTLYKMLVALEACHDADEDLVVRMKRLGEDLAVARAEAEPEEALIFFAACIRWLEAVKQKSFVGYLVHEYAGLSLRLSDGASRDVLHLIGDLTGGAELERLSIDSSLSGVPRSTGHVLLRLSALGAKVSYLELKESLRKTFRSTPPTQEEYESSLIEMTELVIDEIGAFKGPIMKIGQLLAGIQTLPSHARLKIQESLSSTRGLAPEVFLKVFRSEHGKSVDEVFRSFNREPIGVGSMGQVFRAELHDGRGVAVKIHYPGLERSVKALNPCIKLLQMPVRSMFPRIDVPGIARTWMECFVDECDMVKEAAKHQMMFDAFHGRGDIIIPRLIPELTSKSVLVTELVLGLRLFEFAPYASRAERLQFNHVVETVHTETITRLNWLQIDPHAGNYLYCQGKVAFLDFGSMARIGKKAAVAFDEVFAAIKGLNVDVLRETCMGHGIFDPRYITREYFDDVLAPFIMVERHPAYDPEKHQIGRFFDLLRDERLRQGLTAPAEFVLIFLADFLLLMMRETLQLQLQGAASDHAAAEKAALPRPA
jgi:predicted unusual protein kinase regulating ubiquinone biosynthesis (AarF/ABC1/UbiB family)